MSGMWTSIRVEPDEGATMPPLAGLVALWNKHVERSIGYDYRVQGVDAEAHSFTFDGMDADFDYTEESAYLQYHSKYSTEGFDAATAAIAARYPTAIVTATEEWTDEEPSTYHSTYRGGVLVTETVGQELPVGFQGTAASLADTLTDDIARNYLSDPTAHTALVGTINRTIEFLRSLA